MKIFFMIAFSFSLISCGSKSDVDSKITDLSVQKEELQFEVDSLSDLKVQLQSQVDSLEKIKK